MKEITDLHSFADGELSQEESRRIRLLIDSNPKLQEELSSISNLVDCLKEKSYSHRSDECWVVCVKRFNEIDRSRHVEHFVGKYAWAMCAALFVLIIGGRYAVKDVQGDTAHAADLVNFHSSSRITPEQSQLYSSILMNAKQARKLRVSREMAGTVLGTPVYRFDLLDTKGPLSLYVMDGLFNFEDASQLSSVSDVSGGSITHPSRPGDPGINCAIWVYNGRTFVLAGQRTASELSDEAIDLGLRSDR